MGWYYLQVAEVGNTETIKLLTEADGSLLLTTLHAHFSSGVSGLKFRHEESGEERIVPLAVGGCFHPPHADGWGNRIYYCVRPELEENKAKSGSRSEEVGNEEGGNRCSDLIVLSLSYQTTDEELKQHFRAFGNVIHAQVNRDAKTGESKGFGFIRFANLRSQVLAMAQRHNIYGRWCDVKIPNSKDPRELNVSKKVYVAGLTEDITEDVLWKYFSRFGKLTDVYTPKPFRSFAYITFLHGAVAQGLCGEHHLINSTPVTISKWTPTEELLKRTAVSSRRRDHPYENKSHKDRLERRVGNCSSTRKPWKSGSGAKEKRF